MFDMLQSGDFSAPKPAVSRQPEKIEPLAMPKLPEVKTQNDERMHQKTDFNLNKA